MIEILLNPDLAILDFIKWLYNNPVTVAIIVFVVGKTKNKIDDKILKSIFDFVKRKKI